MLEVPDRAEGVDKIKRPVCSGRWVALDLFLLPKFWSLNLSCAPTSRHRMDTGAIIIGIIGGIQVKDRLHISRKHTTGKEMRQASQDKISIKDDVHHRATPARPAMPGRAENTAILFFSLRVLCVLRGEKLKS
jgi:hypothetical protein